MLLLKISYVVLFGALIFFGLLQGYLDKKISEWDLKQSTREENPDEIPASADPEKTGGMLSIGLILLAGVFFIWKMLTATFTPL